MLYYIDLYVCMCEALNSKILLLLYVCLVGTINGAHVEHINSYIQHTHTQKTPTATTTMTTILERRTRTGHRLNSRSVHRKIPF